MRKKICEYDPWYSAELSLKVGATPSSVQKAETTSGLDPVPQKFVKPQFSIEKVLKHLHFGLNLRRLGWIFYMEKSLSRWKASQSKNIQSKTKIWLKLYAVHDTDGSKM